jgi:hypothetical protein
LTTLIKTTGTQLIIASPSFEEAKKIVGGALSVICLTDKYILICRKDYDEDLPQNVSASMLLSYIKGQPSAVCGDVILTDIKFLCAL